MAASTSSIATIQKMYVAYYGRPGDPAGLEYWGSVLDVAEATGGNIDTIIAAFGDSAEYSSNLGTGTTTEQVTALYSQMFGREPDAAGLAYWIDQIDSGARTLSETALAIADGATGDDSITLANKVTAAQYYSDQVTATGATYATDDIDGAKAIIATVTSDPTTVVNSYTATDADLAGQGGSGTSGETFTLTTATDTVTGGSGDDTIIGDVSASTVNASDQISGGSGTDTLKIYGSFTAGTTNTGVMSNIENLFVSAVTNANNDFTTVANKATHGVESISIGDATLLSAKTVTTTAGQSLTLATSGGAATAGAVTWAGSATDTSLDLILNGYQGGTGVTGKDLTVTGALATTQNIASTGSANEAATLTLGAATTAVVVTGDQKFTVLTDIVSSTSATTIKSVDGSANTGGVNITLAADTNAAFTFTGGTGSDSITFANNSLAALTAGSQLDGGAGTTDKIGITDTALSSTELGKINAATNFEVLGLNADITIDGSSVTSVKSFAVDTAALTDVITNMATGAIVTHNASSTAQTYSGAVGVNDMQLDIGSGTNSAITATAVTIGQTQVALSSNGTTGVTNIITTLNNADNSTYTMTGSAGLTITNATDATATGTVYDASAMTGKLTMVGNTTAFSAGSGLGDVIKGGSGSDAITSSVNGATMTGNGGNDNFNVSVALGGVAATAQAPVITDFTSGDIVTFAAFTGTGVFTSAKVDVSGAASAAAAIDIAASGTTAATNATLKWFQYGGDTYMVQDLTNTATFTATDIVVKLTGTLDLSTATFAEASDTLTMG